MSVDWISSGNGNNSFTIGHSDMFALSCDPEAINLVQGVQIRQPVG
jgi:hypothetical protein